MRAAAASAIPLISAVGHETDWTLIDLVADARAPTPTKAAEWAVPKYGELIEQTGKFGLRLKTAAHRALDGMRTHLRAAARGLPRRQDLLALPRQRFDAVERRLGRALLANTRAHGTRLARVPVAAAPRLLEARMARARDRLEALGRRADGSLDAQHGTAPRAPGACRGPLVAAGHRRSRGALHGARGRPRGAPAAVHAQRRRAAHGAISTAAPSCWPRSATRACCSAALRWCATAQGRSVRSVAQVAVGQRARHRACRRPCRCASHGSRRGASRARRRHASPREPRRRATSRRKAAEAIRARCFEGRGVRSSDHCEATSWYCRGRRTLRYAVRPWRAAARSFCGVEVEKG